MGEKEKNSTDKTEEIKRKTKSVAKAVPSSAGISPPAAYKMGEEKNNM